MSKSYRDHTEELRRAAIRDYIEGSLNARWANIVLELIAAFEQMCEHGLEVSRKADEKQTRLNLIAEDLQTMDTLLRLKRSL